MSEELVRAEPKSLRGSQTIEDPQMQIGYFTAGFVYGGGQNAFSATEFMMPPGYNSKAAICTLAKTQTSAWLGISGQKLKEQQQGVADEEIDYAAIRGKLQGALERGQQRSPKSRRS